MLSSAVPRVTEVASNIPEAVLVALTEQASQVLQAEVKQRPTRVLYRPPFSTTLNQGWSRCYGNGTLRLSLGYPDGILARLRVLLTLPVAMGW